MSPLDRRTFLGHGARATAALAAAAAIPAAPVTGTGATEPTSPARLQATAALAAATSPAPGLSAHGLTVNGLVDPLGVDPDYLSFAWLLQSAGRAVRQQAYRLIVRHDDPGFSGVAWDSGTVLSGRQAFVYYGGPAALAADAVYTWTVAVQGPDGHLSGPSQRGRFVTALRQRDWTAQWLHPAPTSPQPDVVTYLRSELTPPAGTLRRATAYISAAHTYRFFVDGNQVDFGPSFSYPDEQYARTVDLTEHLRPGKASALGVLHRWYSGGQGRPASAPGLLVQLSLVYADGRRVTHGTDGSWKEHPAEWLPAPLRNGDGGDFVEWVDGRAHPSGWADAGFDASGWSPSLVRGPVGTAPFAAIFAQRTRVAEQVVEPVSLHTLANGSVVADFGAVYAARPRLQLLDGQGGRTIPMHVGYGLDPDGQVSTTHGTQGTDLSFSYITRSGRQEFEPLTYLGFRYLQIDSPGEPITRDQVVAVAQHAAMPEVPMATFSTDQRMLNSVWNLNARSCLYCTHEQFVDTPTREKGPFVWDSANESEAIMAAYGDQNMSWQGLRDVARGQARYWPDGRVNAVYPNGDGARDLPTFTERYPEWIWRYYVATGDLDTVVLLYPTARKVSDYLWSTRAPTTGLLTGLAEGSNGDPVYGYDQGVTADTTSNVLGINAFNRIGQLAQLAGDAAGALTQVIRSAQLAAAVDAHLVRTDGIYVDGLLPDGTQSGHASQAANALALAYGVVPPKRVATVGAYVASLGIALGPNHGLELLRGLARAGLWTDLVYTLTDTSIPGWAHIVAAGGTFTWEVWQPSDLIGDSMSHGWGSSALVAMQESLLGVTLMTPDQNGAVVAAVSPPASGLNRARGSVPTIAGPLSVQWRRTGTGLSLQAVIPTNASVRISLPASGASAVREGGSPLEAAPGVRISSVGDGLVVLTAGSGSYRFTTQR
ncbi:MAG TPA: family 78 glycoside hydrolase catalytic domain [Acidimicrobiales bacterium]|jgi:alpha-L-rhamnosidase|nr:family 78 glycoside hydrolase catalytic domain [Acidimicrobiales bacterium]